MTCAKQTTCPVCRDITDCEDMMGDSVIDSMAALIITRYNDPICRECAFEHQTCEVCGALVALGEGTADAEGFHECDDHVGDCAKQFIEDRAHIRQESRPDIFL